MKYFYEIYLTKPSVTKEEWQKYIEKISNYQGYFKKWRLIVQIYNYQIRYYLESNCSLPTIMNHFPTFLLKKCNSLQNISFVISYPYIGKGCFNLMDLLDQFKIKKRKNIFRIDFFSFKVPLIGNLYQCFFYTKKNGISIRYYFIPTVTFLALNFDQNKRYSKKSPPKYLDIHKSFHLLKSDFTHSIFRIDTFPYLQGDFYLQQKCYQFDRHSFVLGSSGSGKSKFISLFLSEIYHHFDFRSRYRMIVIDPHASLEYDIGGISRVIDFLSEDDSIHLFSNNKDDIVSSVELFLDLFHGLMNHSYNSKLERVLRHSIYLLLMDENFCFSSLRKLLLDLEWRTALLKKLKNQLPDAVTNFFLTDFNDLKTRSYGEAISPIISFIDEMEMIPVFNRDCGFINLEETVQENTITLFSLDRTKLGDKVVKTISGLIMQQLFTLIQKSTFQEHIVFVVDEVALVENPILIRFLSEARKYHLSLILAGQYFHQISNQLQASILSNVVNYYLFRTSQLDASLLIDHLYMKVFPEDTKEEKMRLLTELNPRECLIRISSNDHFLPMMKATTINFRSIPRMITRKEGRYEKQSKCPKDIHFSLSSNLSLKEIMIKNSSNKGDDI